MSGASHAGHRSSSGESSVHETRTFPGTSDMPGRQSPREQGTPFGSRYVLLSKIGKGGMGEVWKARDLELDQYVALKMIRSDLLEQPDVLERFKREITVARKVTHRNVTRI